MSVSFNVMVEIHQALQMVQDIKSLKSLGFANITPNVCGGALWSSGLIRQ